MGVSRVFPAAVFPDTIPELRLETSRIDRSSVINDFRQQNSLDSNKSWNLVRNQEVEGSNPFAPTKPICGQPLQKGSELHLPSCCVHYCFCPRMKC
jgi:hypothetical protein